MLSAIISSRESERSLVPTLSSLVPGVTGGLLADVVIADANSGDATREVADIAGCDLLSSDAPLGTRLNEAAKTTKGAWLLFLRAGLALDPNWVSAASRFMASSANRSRAGAFREDEEDPTPLGRLIRALFRTRIRPDQGLLISRGFYERIGGHPPSDHADTTILQNIGRRRLVLLPAHILDSVK